MHKQTMQTRIPNGVRWAVYERDGGRCILCGRPGAPNAHYIRRSQGGMGIEENVVTLCQMCHNAYDNGTKREKYGKHIKAYLDRLYPNFPDADRVYDKWSWTED